MIAAAPESSLTSRSRRQAVGVLVAGLRPRQWTKNLLLFAGLLFAAKLGDGTRWLEAATAFVAFCAVSGAAYLGNDVRDAERDRLHPTKRRRPVASGLVSPTRALGLAALLTAGGLGLGAVLGARFELFLAAFLVLQLAYTLVLKKLPVVDVAAIAGCFVLRATAGAAAVEVHISAWLLLCTALLALFLGFAKRRSELVLVGGRETRRRPVLESYSLPLLDALVLSAAISALAAYVAYTLAARESKELVPTLPFVVFGLGRYLWLVYRRDLGEEPEQVLLSDGGIRAAIALWAVTAGVILTAA